jgi:hypothetical protein
MEKQRKKWDAFISHAIEDQESFVRKLAAMLTRLGLSVWYAETALQVGDSLSASINRGLADSEFGIVVISSQFIAKQWTNWELAGLVSRQNSEGGDVILPIWHGITKQEVIDFCPPLADLFALNTATEEADEIAFKLLRRISPTLYSKHDRAQLEKLASGEAMNDLQAEIELTREELEAAREDLAEYRCPYCRAPLSSRNDAPVDVGQRDWDVIEHFSCGFSHFGGEIQSPCPADPKFPRFDDYELRYEELETDRNWRWSCLAIGKTPMARLLNLASGLGKTQDEATTRVKESYDRYAKGR